MTPLVSLRQASLRVRDRVLLEDITWDVRLGEHWAVLGPNGAGKSTLVRALVGEVPVVRGGIFPPEPARLREQAACVSFEHARRLAAQEDRREHYQAFGGRLESGARVSDFIRLPRRREKNPRLEVLERIRIEPLLNRFIRELSSGEMRRFQIGLALGAAPRLLILDEPYEGLDPAYREELAELLNELMGPERAVVLVTHRRSEIPTNATHVIGLKRGRIAFQGRIKELLDAGRMDALYASPVWPPSMLPVPAAGPARSDPAPSDVLIDLRRVTVRHRGIPLFEPFSWTVRSGQHWAVCGPNGCGKSTLLSLVTGDHPQAYANSVRVLGIPRGFGGSIRDTRAGIGLISAELQVRYRKDATAFDVVLSGFFDSVGLYRRASADQRAAAAAWLECLGLQALSGKKFNYLSQGEQRMLLLARAMVKSPRLLVLDEPCQGLDAGNRRLVLRVADHIAASGSTTLLYVSHRADEIPACITHYLVMVREGGRPTRAVMTEAPVHPSSGAAGRSPR
jgi:molybdate transport system ATP-binding protein